MGNSFDNIISESHLTVIYLCVHFGIGCAKYMVDAWLCSKTSVPEFGVLLCVVFFGGSIVAAVANLSELQHFENGEIFVAFSCRLHGSA